MQPLPLSVAGPRLTKASSDPLFQRTLVKVVRQSQHLFGGHGEVADGETWTGLPVIFDEVFTGLYRLGRFSAASFLGVEPDISVHAKLLTGGLVPLSLTLASESIFRAFESDDKSDALLHGHSYTAHAVGCQVALESVREMQKMDTQGDWAWAKIASQEGGLLSADEDGTWSVWNPEFILWLSQLPTSYVDGVWALGTVLAIRLASVDGTQGYQGSAAKEIQAALLRGSGSDDESGWSVHTRVLGNTLYLMTGQKTTQESVKRLENRLRRALWTAQGGSQA